MASDWQLITIDDIKADTRNSIAMGPFGSNIKTENFVPSGVPVIRGINLAEGRFREEDFVFLTEEKANELRSANAFPGDIVITHRGTLGQVGIIPENGKYQRYVISQSQMKLTCDTSKADPLFVYYFLCSPEGQNALLSNTSTTGVPAIAQPLTSLKRISIPLPPLPEQRAISGILGTIDDKIQLNKKMNQTLEQIAQAIFNHWFVDFEFPNEGGKPYKSSGGEMVDSELGEIPKGWIVGKVSDICSTQYGYTASTSKARVGPHFLRITDMNKEPWIDWSTVPYCEITNDKFDQYRLEYGDVLVSRMADPGKAAIVEAEVPSVFASYLIKLKTNSLAWSYYLFCFLRSPQYLEYAQGAMGGSVQANMNAKVITAAQMVIPVQQIVDKFLKLLLPFRQTITLNLQQSHTIASIRDALLPKLLSGEIRVNASEKITSVKQ